MLLSKVVKDNSKLLKTYSLRNDSTFKLTLILELIFTSLFFLGLILHYAAIMVY